MGWCGPQRVCMNSSHEHQGSLAWCSSRIPDGSLETTLAPHLPKNPLRRRRNLLSLSHCTSASRARAIALHPGLRSELLNNQDLLTPYSQKYLKYISQEGISRKTASLIFQLQVGHTPTNQYLHRFKKVDGPWCLACGFPKETTEHFLLQCLKYKHECWPLLGHAKSRPPNWREFCQVQHY